MLSIKGLKLSLDAAVVAILREMPAWTPAQINNLAVPTNEEIHLFFEE